MGLLDPYAQPRSDRKTLAERREMLRDQLAWLMDEAAALVPLMNEMPEWAVSESALAGERSVKATLARMAALDDGPRTTWLRAFAGETQTPSAPAAEEPFVGPAATELPVEQLLESVREARARLLEALAAVAEDDWGVPVTVDEEPATLYDLALRIAREDADELRALAYRLHEARPERRG